MTDLGKPRGSTKMSVVYGEESADLARRIAKKIGSNLVRAKVRVFSDGESKITLGKLTGRTIIVKSLHPPVDTNLIQVLSLISKAREESSEVMVVIPYMGYARQDKEFLSGEIVTMKVLGRLFRGVGASRIVTVDIHSITGLKYFARSENVTAIPDLAMHFKKLKLRDPLAVSPDQGGKDRAEKFAEALGLGFVALEKKRDRMIDKVTIKTRNMDGVAGRDIILIDDMISTGGSIVKAAQFLKKQGCRRIYAACTHALLIGDAEKRIRKAGVSGIVSTNTIPGSTSTVDVSGTIAKALM